MKEGKYLVGIIDNKEFDQARKCLEARRKQLKKDKAKKVKTNKQTNKTKTAEPLSEKEIKSVNILYEKYLGFRRSDKVLAQNNLTKLIVLLNEKAIIFIRTLKVKISVSIK